MRLCNGMEIHGEMIGHGSRNEFKALADFFMAGTSPGTCRVEARTWNQEPV